MKTCASHHFTRKPFSQWVVNFAMISNRPRWSVFGNGSLSQAKAASILPWQPHGRRVFLRPLEASAYAVFLFFVRQVPTRFKRREDVFSQCGEKILQVTALKLRPQKNRTNNNCGLFHFHISLESCALTRNRFKLTPEFCCFIKNSQKPGKLTRTTDLLQEAKSRIFMFRSCKTAVDVLIRCTLLSNPALLFCQCKKWSMQ